jgi:hypothetical protein
MNIPKGHAVVAVGALGILLLALGDTVARSGQKPGPETAGPPPGPVVNQVIDLLDSDVHLDTETGDNLWESETFDTSQFTSIGIFMSGEATIGSLSCATSWQFSDDDEFLESFPNTSISASGFLRNLDPEDNFTAVMGLRARVRCRATPGGDIGTFPPSPLRGSGTVTDVRILLRRT